MLIARHIAVVSVKHQLLAKNFVLFSLKNNMALDQN